ncbi:MAG TPA: hypothetical protein VKR06_07535 [Ktedonosporobacter sp.]|nr:hypothetical protein [Ktedonosporobacter sp.]
MPKRKQEPPAADIQPLLLTIPQAAMMLGVHSSRPRTVFLLEENV